LSVLTEFTTMRGDGKCYDLMTLCVLVRTCDVRFDLNLDLLYTYTKILWSPHYMKADGYCTVSVEVSRISSSE